MAAPLVKRFRHRELSLTLKGLKASQAAVPTLAQGTLQPKPASAAAGQAQAKASAQATQPPQQQQSLFPLRVQNPFLPTKNPATGRWAPPKYSRRRQAELIKQAKATNSLHLLPPGPKMLDAHLKAAVKATPKRLRPGPLPEEKDTLWAKPVMWTGKLKERKVKGADIGNRLYAGKKRMFKGHRWQRTMASREARRKMLMRSMKSRVRRFKSVRASKLGLIVLLLNVSVGV